VTPLGVIALEQHEREVFLLNPQPRRNTPYTSCNPGKNASCEKLATGCCSKAHRPPILSNRCKSKVSLLLEKENPHEEDERDFCPGR